MIIENSMQIVSLIWWISVKVSPFCSAQHWFDTGYIVQTSWDRIIPLRLPVSPSTHEPMSPVEWTQLALIDSICGYRHFYLFWIVLDFVPQCNSCNIQLDSKAMYERNVNFLSFPWLPMSPVKWAQHALIGWIYVVAAIFCLPIIWQGFFLSSHISNVVTSR